MFQLLAKDVHLNQQAADKTAAIEAIATALTGAGYVAEGYVQGMLQREQQAATYLGNGIAIPHGTTATRDQVKQTGVQVFHFPQGVAWGDDGELAYIAIGIAASSDEHLTLLRQLTHVLADDAVIERIAQIQTVDDVIAILTGKKVAAATNGELEIYCRLDLPVDDIASLQALNASQLLKSGAVNSEFVSQVLAQSPVHLGDGVWLSDATQGNLRSALVVGRPQTAITMDDHKLQVLLTVALTDDQQPLVERLAQAALTQQLTIFKQGDAAAITAFLQGKSVELPTTAAPKTATAADDGETVTATFEVLNPHGLHTRPSSNLIKLIKQFNSQITVANLDGANQPVKASSLMKLVALGAKKGQRLQFTATGADAAAAIQAIGEAMASGLGEEIA